MIVLEVDAEAGAKRERASLFVKVASLFVHTLALARGGGVVH